MRIFISRTLAEDSPIRQVAVQHEIVDAGLIDFEAVAFEAPLTDWVFFYSKNGVKFFFDNNDYALHPYQWAAMGPGTASALAQYVTDISFVGHGNPTDIAIQFAEALHPSESITFITAETSRDSIRHHLGLPESASTIVYTNRPKKVAPTGKYEILIFTSPMSVKTWLTHHAYLGETVIAIGKTTAAAAYEMGITDVQIPDVPTEESIADLLLHILK